MSNLHRSLANAQLCPRVLLSVLYLKNTFYPVCYIDDQGIGQGTPIRPNFAVHQTPSHGDLADIS